MRYTDFTPFDLVLLAQGLGVTIGLFLVTSLIGVVIGVLFGVIRFYRIPVLMQVVTFVTELLKNSPVLVQLFLVFFGFPAFFHVNVTPVTAAVMTLSANTAAFVYVIAVSSIESIGRDQVEAARVARERAAVTCSLRTALAIYVLSGAYLVLAVLGIAPVPLV